MHSGNGNGAPQSPTPSKRSGGASDTSIMRAAGFESIAVIPQQEFTELARLIYDNFGIKVGENKRMLVSGRIHPMMEKRGFPDHRAFVDAILGDGSGELVSELANRISTNHTAFYREEAHFTALRERILPEAVARRKASGDKDLRVWCAAASTGEEAYSILFTMMEYFGMEYANWRAGVLATDISASALAAGKKGVYSAQRVEPVPRTQLLRYFDSTAGGEYEVKEEVRREVTFRRFNLNSGGYPFKNRFDIIFCRNVMIYFSREVRLRLVEKMREWLVPGGVFVVGHSESLAGAACGLEYLAPALYARPMEE